MAPIAIAGRTVLTVMVADLSGSTALGERLDPEDLRLVVGGFFQSLTHEIHRFGGTIDKYVGDAIRANFAGPSADDSAVRGLSAGVAMLDALATRNEDLERKYGMRLKLRIGVNTGEVLWSGPTGKAEPTVGRTVSIAQRLESTAVPNTVHLGEATYRAARRKFEFKAAPLITITGADDLERAYELIGTKRRIDGGSQPIETAVPGGGASLQVGPERAHLLEEQRKVVTVLFADLAEPIADRLETEVLQRVLGSYFSAVSAEIARFGGTIDKYVGDAVMAVFGAPLSHEDDAARAVHAALGIHAALRKESEAIQRQFGVRLVAHIGINTGEVVAGILPGEVTAYTVTGDTVNTAQRIESATPGEQTYVSATTHAVARNAFVYERVGELTLKGKSAPVAAFRVIAPERRASPRASATLIGREAELARLYAAFRAAAAGSGTAVHLHGEAGVGKTRLVTDFLTGIPAARRIRARANSYEQATPYALVAEVVRRMFAIAPADTEDAARAALAGGLGPTSVDGATTLLLEILGYGVVSQLDPQGKRRLAIALLRQSIRDRGRERPIVLVLEDLHWTDPTSADVLTEVAGAVSSERCLLLSTARDAAAPWPAEAIALEALDLSAAEQLIDRVAAAPVDPATRALILERTAGNPFFIEEIVRSLKDGALASVPATVQDLLEARLDALESSPRRVAHAGAVIGRTFWERVVARVTPDIDVPPALGTLTAQRLVNETAQMPEHAYSFAHALVQEVAYRTQLMTNRRRTHVAVGDAYTALFEDRVDEFVDTLAFHYRRGDDDPKARTWLLRAGRRAQRLYANAEAVDYFTAAVERSADDPPARAEALEAMGDVQRVLGKFDDALVVYARARDARSSSELVARARVDRKTAIIHQLRGDMATALSMFEEVLGRLPSDAAAERSHALLNIAEVRWRQGRYDDAVTTLETALADAEQANEGDARAETLKQLGTVHSHRGDLERALTYFAQSLGAYEELGDVLGQANVQNNIGLANRRRSRHADALAAYQSALAIRERIGDQLGRVHSHNNLGQIEYLRGDLAAAEADFAAGLEIATALGYTMGIGATGLGLGATKVARGDTAVGIAQLRAAVDVLEQGGSLANLVDGLRDLAIGLIAAHSPEALAVAERALQIAQRLGLAESKAIAHQILGMARSAAGDLPGAIDALDESRSILERLDERQELARTIAALGHAYARLPATDDRRRASADLIAKARAIFTELDAALDLRRIDAS